MGIFGRASPYLSPGPSDVMGFGCVLFPKSREEGFPRSIRVLQTFRSGDANGPALSTREEPCGRAHGWLRRELPFVGWTNCNQDGEVRTSRGVLENRQAGQNFRTGPLALSGKHLTFPAFRHRRPSSPASRPQDARNGSSRAGAIHFASLDPATRVCFGRASIASICSMTSKRFTNPGCFATSASYVCR
jgi:hypothetical protein